MAWLFETAGLKAKTLEGGYKAYRRFIRQEFSKEAKMIIEYIQTTFYDNFEKLAYDLNVNQDRIKRILSLTRRFDIT